MEKDAFQSFFYLPVRLCEIVVTVTTLVVVGNIVMFYNGFDKVRYRNSVVGKQTVGYDRLQVQEYHFATMHLGQKKCQWPRQERRDNHAISGGAAVQEHCFMKSLG